MQYKTYLDGGGYSSYGLATVYYTGALQTVTYKVPAYKFEGVRVFTNKPACGQSAATVRRSRALLRRFNSMKSPKSSASIPSNCASSNW